MPNLAEILELISSTDSDSIREGARWAGRERVREAIPGLVENLSSSNVGVQEACDRALRKIGGAEVVIAVIPLLQSDEAPTRNLSMDILRALGKSSIDSVVALLSDNDVDLRIFAADILGSIKSPRVIGPLGQALLRDPEVNVRYQAAVSLGEVGSHEAAVFLNQALNDEEWVQFSVIEALTKIRDESSVTAMIAALERSTDLIVSTIIDALGEMGNIKAAPLLLRRLDSSPTALCNKIVKAIIKILGGRSLSLLGNEIAEKLRGYMEVALTDEDTEIQDAAIAGLAALGGDSASTLIVRAARNLDQDKSAERIDFITDSLAKIGYNKGLATSLSEAEERSQLLILAALEKMAKERAEKGEGTLNEAVAFVISLFWGKSRDVQRSMIRFLAKAAPKDQGAFFMDVLARHRDGLVLREALAFLGTSERPEEVQDAVFRMLDHPYNDVKEAALEALILLDTPKVREHFHTLVSDANPLNRLMATFALGVLDAEAYVAELTRAASDPESSIRKVAVETLGRLVVTDQGVSEELLKIVMEAMADECRDVRMVAVEILGSCPNTPDICVDDILIGGLADSDQWVQVRCATKLGERRSEKAIESLIILIANEENLVIIHVIKALAEIGGPKAFRFLMELMNYQDPEIQNAAEEAVSAMSGGRGK
jgi:FOG: HEAT repeat